MQVGVAVFGHLYTVFCGDFGAEVISLVGVYPWVFYYDLCVALGYFLSAHG